MADPTDKFPESKQSQTAPADERREHTRFPTTLAVDYASGDNFLFSYIDNISEMGIFIRSAEPLPIGTPLRLRFRKDTPPFREKGGLEIEGDVVWHNPVKLGAENLNPGMGVKFRDLTPEKREEVVAVIRTVAYLNGPGASPGNVN